MGDGTGVKAGAGAAAAIGGLLILAAITWFILRSRRQKRWETQNMENMAMGKYYVQRGTVQRQEDLALGLQSTNMHDMESILAEDKAFPSVPPRSPSRLGSGNDAI
jgi:hypothetical protein